MFEGAGMGATTIQLAANPGHDVTGVVRTDSGKTNADGTPVSCHDVTIRNLTIDANKAGAGSADVDGFFSGPKPFTATGIDTNITLDQVEVCNASRYGFDPHERTDGLTFNKCVSHDNVVDGFTIDYCSNVTFTGCEAYNNGRHGFNIVTSSYDVLMQGTKSHHNGASGLVVQTGIYETRVLTNGVTIEGGAIWNNTGDGIVVRQATERHHRRRRRHQRDRGHRQRPVRRPGRRRHERHHPEQHDLQQHRRNGKRRRRDPRSRLSPDLFRRRQPE